MSQSRQVLNIDEPREDYGSMDANKDSNGKNVGWRRHQKTLLTATILLLLVIIIILLGVIAHLLSSGGDDEGGTDENDYGRPFLKWREQGQCPPVPPTCPAGPPPVLVVSLDGFRPEYLNFGVSPTLQDLRDCGVTAPYVRVSFPSKTFPNHYSIVTGMYPESHGVVDNKMYDPSLPGRKFRLGNSESLKKVWWKAEPVWQTVKNKGDVSAVYFWPGSEVPGQLPSHFKPYNKKTPFKERVSQIIDWLMMPPPLRPRYLSLYFDEPDTSGHKYGPWSKEVRHAVHGVDQQLANLYTQLMEHGLLGCVDVIVTSDHGMAEMREPCENVILDDYVPGLSENSTYVNGPVARVRPDNASDVADLVDRLDCSHPALRVWHKHELPQRWHYQQSPRIEPIVATVDLGYGLSVRSSDFCLRGTHGWDVDLPDMRAIFIGHGPTFKINYTSPPFENVQMYSLFQTLLELPDIENNATKHSLDHVLLDPPTDSTPVGTSGTVPSQKLEETLNNDCCSQINTCSCRALNHWTRQESLNSSDPFPLPVVDAEDRMEAATDGAFVAALFSPSSPVKSYRWLQYNIERDERNNTMLAPLASSDGGCLLTPAGDAGSTANCSLPQDQYRSLVLTPDLGTYLQRVTRTMYPMRRAYQTRVLPELQRRLAGYWLLYRMIVVLAGPAYLAEEPEMDSWGQPVPSHFFYQLRMCDSRDCPPETIQHKQWILPNQETLRTCEVVDKFVDFHEATLKDVERVSGLTLFAGQVTSQPSSPHLSHARFITQLPEFRAPQDWSAAAANQNAAPEDAAN